MAQLQEKPYYNIQNLNKLFLVAVVLLFASVVYMVWTDYDRDWKKYQKKFTGLKLEKLNEKLKEADMEFENLRQAEKDTDTLRLKIDKFTRERTHLNKLIRDTRPGIMTFFRNAPLLNFISPSLKIRQVLLDGLKEELNFVQVGKVDRCITCHLGIDNTGFKDAPKPFDSHPVIDLYGAETSPHPVGKFGCTICHEGRGRATDFSRASHTPVNSEQEHEWKKKYDWEEQEHWDLPMLPKGYVQASCQKCHIDTKGLSGAEVLSGGWDVIEKRGCLGCHKVEGLESAMRTGPDLTGTGDKVSRKWLIKWLKKPKEYLPKTKMPDFMLSDREAADLSAYILTFKREEFQKLPLPPDGDEDRGEDLFRRSACITCHAVNGRGGDIGPDLGRAGNKTNRKWLFYWIKNPRHVYTETARPVMPRYNFTDEQIADIASYLMVEFVDYDLLEKEEIEGDLPPCTPDEVKSGMKLFKDYGCGGCHPSAESAKEWVRIGPDLSSEGRKRKRTEEFDFGLTKLRRTMRDFIFTKLKNPRIFETPDTKLMMPQMDLTDNEAYAITVVIMGLIGERVATGEYIVPPGPGSTYEPKGPFKKILDRYACWTCHTTYGKGGTLAPDLTLEGSKVQREWLRDFLTISHSVNPLIANAMPIFNFTEEEKDIIVNYMKTSFISENVPDMAEDELTPDLAGEGEKIFNKSGCKACHIKGEGGGYVGPSFTTGRHYAGDRLTAGWIYKWLENPQEMNPETIEPRYNFTERERLCLTAYLMSLKNPGQTNEIE